MNAFQKHNGESARASRRPLRVLLVEDSEADAFLLEHKLRQGGYDTICGRVDTREAMASALEERSWDIILADHAMPLFSAPEALELMKQKQLDLPFIIVSGHIEEETAVSAMMSGAHDYIMKDRLARLVPAVERELREAEVRRARARSEEELRRAHEELEMRVEKRTAALKAANQKLQNVIEERKRLENELLEIAENERRRIGFDLHDDLGQKLTGAQLMVKALERRLVQESHPSAEEAVRIRELIDQIIRHTHDLAHEFSSLDVSGNDLCAVLRQLAENVKRMFGVRCVFSLKGELPNVPENVPMQFYKIAQEAVSNAIKHGKATQVAITLCRNADGLVLAVRNDGVPFSPPADAKTRMGLRIMNYRANTIGASFEIKANPKGGALVTCLLPVRTARAPRARAEEVSTTLAVEDEIREVHAPAEV